MYILCQEKFVNIVMLGCGKRKMLENCDTDNREGVRSVCLSGWVIASLACFQICLTQFGSCLACAGSSPQKRLFAYLNELTKEIQI
jgi:hypothetical protein